MKDQTSPVTNTITVSGQISTKAKSRIASAKADTMKMTLGSGNQTSQFGVMINPGSKGYKTGKTNIGERNATFKAGGPIKATGAAI